MPAAADEQKDVHSMKFRTNKRPEGNASIELGTEEEQEKNYTDEESDEEAVKLRVKRMEPNYKPLDADEQCGCFSLFRSSKWLQKFATRRTFLFVFCLSSVTQGIFFTYFVSCLTTIEKLFQIKSQTIGLIMSTTEIGQIGGGLLLAYFAANGHRPRWIAGGMVLFSFSVLLCSTPHFLFGDEVLQNFLASAPTHEDPLSTANICNQSHSTLSGGLLTANDSLLNTSENCLDLNGNSRIVLSLFFIALLGVGLGQTALFNIGIPYLDDSIANEDSPTYFGTTIGVRIFGPTLGFVLGSFCTRLSIDPFAEPKFEPTDPRWIGAWWLGLVLIAFVLFLVSLLMMMFPKNLPKEKPKIHPTQISEALYSSVPKLPRSSKCCYQSLQREYATEDMSQKAFVTQPCEIVSSFKDKTNLKFTPSDDTSYVEKSSDAGETKSLKDFFLVVGRLLRNRVLVLRTASSVLHILPISGLYTFLPKYLETQFRLTVHSAAMISGVGGILVMGVGIFLSGFVIRKLNPSPRSVAAWIAITALLYSIGMIILMFLGCEDVIQKNDSSSFAFSPLCNTTCTSCDVTNFSPICSSDGLTYFSACHVGCSSVKIINETNDLLFDECECLGESVTSTLGFCDVDCPNLVWYVAIFCVFVLIHSTSEVGGMLVTLRCVKPADKVMALGLISVAIGLFGNVPCTILYGAVIDNACIHSRESCGVKGACQIYDPQLFSTYFHGITAVLTLAAFFFDVAVWYYAKEISFSDDGASSKEKASGTPEGGSISIPLSEEDEEERLAEDAVPPFCFNSSSIQTVEDSSAELQS